jgi:hypothetical protein
MDSWTGVLVSFFIISIVVIGGIFFLKRSRGPELLEKEELFSEKPLEAPSSLDWD